VILTCFRCPAQLAFPGRYRLAWAHRFGWQPIGSGFCCRSCQEDEPCLSS
jgi:hypothetical protein